MSYLFFFIGIVCLLSQMGQTLYFENQGCTEKTSDGFECKTCSNGFTLQNGLCRMNDFNHTVKSDHTYFRVYVGQEIVASATSDPILNRVIRAVKEHAEFQPSITMVRERSQVSTRTNYRVFCQNPHKKIDFFVYYFYKTDSITIVGVNATSIEASAANNARLLSIMGNGYLSGVLAIFADKKVRKQGNSGAASIVKQRKQSPKNEPPKIVFSTPSVVRGKKAQTILVNACTLILKYRNMIQTKLMTHKWSKCRKGWQNEIRLLENKHLQCLKNPAAQVPTPVPTPDPIIVNPVVNPTTPAVISSQVDSPSSVTDYTNVNQHQGSVTVNEEQIYKTESNLSPEYFTDDVRMVVEMFSMQQQLDLTKNIIFIEFKSDGTVDEYAVTARFRANDTVRFYALRIVVSNEFLFMGKEQLAAAFDPSLQANKFLQSIIPMSYTAASQEMFASLALFITAHNNTHFDMTKLEVARRVYPNGSYYVTNIHIQNDVNAVSYVVKLNGAQFMNIKYEQTQLLSDSQSTTDTTLVITTPTVETTTTPPGETTVPLYASSSCCSTLQQKQDACVSYLKQYFGPTQPLLIKAQLVYTENQALPSGVSFDFYLEYADPLFTIGYTATVARFNDGSYTILMFDQA